MNNTISIFIIPPLLSLFFGGYLAALAIISIRSISLKSRVLFALMCIWYSLLAPLFICHHLIDDIETILFIERKVHFFYAYLPVVFIVFIHHLLGLRRPRVMVILTVLSVLFSLTTQSDYYLAGLYEYRWGYIAKGGPAFQLFGIYGALAMVYSVVQFVRRIKSENNPAIRMRFKYVAFSFGVAVCMTFLNIPAMQGIDFYPLGNFSFLPLAMIAYGLFKHRLVEVRSFLHISFIRAALFMMVLVPNAILVMNGASFLSSLLPELQFMVLAFWFLLNYLYVRHVLKLFRKWLYKSRTELQKEEAGLIKEMLVLSNTDELALNVSNAICRILPFNWLQILKYDANKHGLVAGDETEHAVADRVVARLISIHGVIERASLERLVGDAEIQAQLHQLMKTLKAAYATPLVHNEMLVGLLILSKKHNQQPLHQDEATFIKNISGTLALAFSNAAMYQRIAALRDHLQRRTEALSMEIGERKRAEASLKAMQLELETAHVAMEKAILQANEMTAKIEINNHVLQQEMEDRKKIEKALRQSEQRYRIITENSADVIWSIDFEGRFTFMSPSVVHQLQYTHEEMMAMKIEDILTSESLSITTKTITDELSRGFKPDSTISQSRTLELEQVRKDGTTFWTEVNTRFVIDENEEIVGVMGVTRDITERRKSEQDLIYMAYHDALTGLYNRKAFMEFLDKEVKYAQRYRSGLGLLFFDLNKFKHVNDTFGHEIGDRLLTSVAERLSNVVRETDLVARLGGDEFTIILKNPDNLCEEIVAKRIAEDLSRPFELDGVMVSFVSASIGIASYPEDGTSAEDLIKNADTAMYKAKKGVVDWVRYSDIVPEAV